jgi:hypothetical protein
VVASKFYALEIFAFIKIEIRFVKPVGTPSEPERRCLKEKTDENWLYIDGFK